MIPNDPRVSDPASDKGNILNPRKLDIADEIAVRGDGARLPCVYA